MVEMTDSRTTLGHCELPTGVEHEGHVLQSLHFREMAGPEEDLFANRKMSVSRKFTQVMQNCITKIGTHQDRTIINKCVEKMVETDRIYLLLQLRILSVGNEISFSSQCPECGKVDNKVFDLANITIKDPPHASNLFMDVEIAGQKFRLKAADGKAEALIEKAQNEDKAISLAMFARIDSIDDRPASISDVIQLSLKNRKKLRDAIDKLEGRVDDKFDADCPHCGHHYVGEVPLAGPDFLAL